MEVRPVGKSDNERLRVRRRRGGLVYDIHGHSGDVIRIRILGVDLISILAFKALIFSQGYGDGEEACREDKEANGLTLS
ncbi:BnaA06g10700D [Brassica napus]|uniref:BnaA06g10700D protein n=1 Tax=Brassica napus TaxID=3708 RepID=A0A078H9G6_BRANA|nr:BnaA06g10700D [Brassica napus]